MAENILQYESTIWKTADLLHGCGIKESEWPSHLMPFFALSMIESRLLLGVNAGDGEKFLDRRGVISRLKAKKVLFSYAKEWSQIDRKPFNNSESPPSKSISSGAGRTSRPRRPASNTRPTM